MISFYLFLKNIKKKTKINLKCRKHQINIIINGLQTSDILRVNQKCTVDE